MRKELLVLLIALSGVVSAQAKPGALMILPNGLNGDAENSDAIMQSAFQHKPLRMAFDETRNETTGQSLKLRFGGKTYWVGHQFLKTVAMDLHAKVFTSPSFKSMSLGTLSRADLVDDVILTGRTRLSQENGESWSEILFLGKPAWVQSSAFKIAASTPEAPTSKKTGPSCVSSEREAMRSPRFRTLMEQGSPFTTWTSTVGASVTISPDGQAVLHHPINGDLSALVSLCLSANGKPYAVVNGGKYSQTVHFSGPNMNSFSLVDPESHSSYVFARTSQ